MSPPSWRSSGGGLIEAFVSVFNVYVFFEETSSSPMAVALRTEVSEILQPLWYNHAMPIRVSDKELDQIESGREAAVIVRSDRTKKGYALIPQKLYDQLRPLLQYVVMHVEAPVRGRRNGHAVDWTPEKNVRRVALINKKHDKGLTSAEKKELSQLISEADDYRDITAPVGNYILELILAGLQNRKPQPSKR
jgi:hypothetical protein